MVRWVSSETKAAGDAGESFLPLNVNESGRDTAFCHLLRFLLKTSTHVFIADTNRDREGGWKSRAGEGELSHVVSHCAKRQIIQINIFNAYILFTFISCVQCALFEFQ